MVRWRQRAPWMNSGRATQSRFHAGYEDPVTVQGVTGNVLTVYYVMRMFDRDIQKCAAAAL
jgi:hypothetical protein